jgi:crossover junction endodeoxyribonuclease RusA
MNADRLQLTVTGPPVPWKRARSNGKRRYTDPAMAEYQERVRAAWMVEGRPELAGYLALSATFVIERPKSHYGTGRNAGVLRPTAPEYPGVPDLDNYVKNVGDALNGLAWGDDAQIVCLVGVQKVFAPYGHEPYTEVMASTLDAE